MIKKFFSDIGRRYKQAFAEHGFTTSLILGVFMLIGTLIFNYFAVIYTTARATSSVGDIILSNVPIVDMDYVFVFGPIIFFIILAFVTFHNPKTLPFTIKSIALFVLVRSCFITLTHIGPFPNHIVIDGNPMAFLHLLSSDPHSVIFSIFSTGADLFFSGHTGLPFMLAFVFWDKWVLRSICIIASVFFGVTVLLGHLHYSIDVASAFFISYTIYKLATHFFKSDQARFRETFPVRPVIHN